MNGNIERGIIRSIYLKNFVTYDEVIVRPGRNLNLIIGANGTGKSTLVSAIVLGLGGKPSVLDKSSLASFVKSELNQATIKIELEDKPGYPTTVTRTITKDNKSTWMINDKSCSTSQVMELMKDMNIQVDNLCQFLPQEKVQSFSTMTPVELLEETERSVGDPHLLEYHKELKKIREQQSKVEGNLVNMTNCRENYQQKYNRIKDTVGQIQERKKVENKINSMKQKRAWVLYGEKMNAFKASKSTVKLIQDKKDEIERDLQPGAEQIECIKKKLKNCENLIRGNDGMKARTKINNAINMIANCEQKMNDLDIAKEVKIRDEQERGATIHNLTQQRNKLVNDLQQMVQDYGSIQDLKKKANEESPELNQYRNEITELKQRVARKKQDLIEKDMEIRSHESEKANIRNVHDQRLYLLQQKNSHAFQAVQWLRNNKDQFVGRVFEPMLLYINVPKNYAKYFENHISLRDLVAFVCEEKEDMNRLIRYANQQKLKINVLHSDPNWPSQVAPRIPLRDIERFGFECYMASLLDAPDTIKKYLLRNYRLQDIPIGSDDVAKHLDNLPRSINKFFTKSNSYSVNYSRYTGQKSTRQSHVYSHDTLTITLDSNKLAQIEARLEELQRLKSALNEEVEVFNAQYHELDQKMQVLRKAKLEIQHHIQQIQHVESKLSKANLQLKDLEDRRTSIDEIERQHKEEMRKIIMDQMKIYKQYNLLFKESFQDIMKSEEMKLQKTLLRNQLEAKKNEIQELQDNLDSAKIELENAKREFTNLKNESLRLFKEAKALTGDIESSDKRFEPYQRAFEKLPATAEELFEEIQNTQGRLWCLQGQNAEQDRRTLEEFDQLKRDIEKLDREIADRDRQHAQINAEIKVYYDKWYPTITALTEKINENFSRYFATIKCAGQVELISADNKMDFDKYGLQIKVKFRDSDELQILTRTHQSGGERALTTAIYMISLQELSIVPFRCMDEINQGMDPTNERRVFELIVHITSNTASSQYFLLTPKLLPGLKYEDSVTVLTIFSGRYNVASTSFDVTENFDDILQAVRERAIAV